ncbi:MAG: MmgE/PrpD family protein [Chloroflexota bacterium]|nr:MmgE/PrpD family protein [Chloroflexota bacterium]
MNETRQLAEFIAQTNYTSLDQATIQAAKIAILDGVANMVAGSTQELSDIVGEYIKEQGGTPTSSVIGWGFKTNAPSAAFANGVFGHCLDFEIQGFPPTHGTSSCLPAALAIGENIKTSGKSIITAYTLGWEIQGRLREASAANSHPALHPPGLVGPFGGATSSAKVLGLDTQKTLMALGIAASRTGGLTANTGTMVKSTHPGNAARMGAESALLADKGYTSSEQSLESKVGYAEGLFQGNLDWNILLNGLGESYRLINPGFDIKRFPAQVYMQNPIEAVLNLREHYHLDAEKVTSITVHRRGRGHAGPIPQTGLDGKFSVEYCAAVALLDGKVGIDSFTDQRRFAEDMELTLPKVKVDPEGPASGTVVVSATLVDGTTIQDECSTFRGSAENPMNESERTDKIIDCVSRSLSDGDTQEVIGQLNNLEELDDISQLMDLIGKASRVRS